jgi:hypothetical protein
MPDPLLRRQLMCGCTPTGEFPLRSLASKTITNVLCRTGVRWFSSHNEAL